MPAGAPSRHRFLIIRVVGLHHLQPNSGLAAAPLSEENVSGIGGPEPGEVAVHVQGDVIEIRFLCRPIREGVVAEPKEGQHVAARHSDAVWRGTEHKACVEFLLKAFGSATAASTPRESIHPP